ncbi:MAG: hypothetical protein KGZ60_14390 [Truepera sp.]|nr:hypothetical protein [Truepera sp.]
MRWLLALLCLGGTMAWAEEGCEDFSPRVLTIDGLASVWYQNLTIRDGLAQFSGGVCVELVSAPSWRLEATELASTPEGFELQAVSLSSREVTATALTARFDLAAEALILQQVTAQSPMYRLSGAQARLQGDVLWFTDALATTCVCEGEALYLVGSPEARFDLTYNRVLLREGVLKIGGLSLPLPAELTISEEALANLEAPLIVEYLPSDPERGVVGSGLGVRVPNLPLDDGLSLELGVTGLDVDYPLNAIALLRLRRPDMTAEIGKAREGWQIDVTRYERLLPWLSLTYGTRNRPYAAQDYLQEAFAGVVMQQAVPNLLGGDRLALRGELFAAGSSQVVNGSHVLSPRLGGLAGIAYRSPTTPLGRLEVAIDASLTSYPSTPSWQYGLRLRPAWTWQHAPLSVTVRYDRQWTNSGSPFSTTLDRLSPIHAVAVTAMLAGPLGSGAGSLSVSGSYNLLPEPGRNPLQQLSLSAEAELPAYGVTVRPSLTLNAAGWFNPVADPKSLANLQAGLEVLGDVWTVGLRARYNFVAPRPGLDRLELSSSFPLTFDTVTLTPFLALELAPLLLTAEPPRVSGHGLTVTWRSCCGTIEVGYRQHDNQFTTRLALRLGQ